MTDELLNFVSSLRQYQIDPEVRDELLEKISSSRAPAQKATEREALESARDYIASVNFYAAGTPAYIKNCDQLIKIDAALAHTRPEHRPTEIEDGQS